MFQAMIHDLLKEADQPSVVDLGCGTGLVMIAAEPTVVEGGELLGLDVREEDIDFCRRHYTDPPFRFARLGVGNALNAPEASGPTAVAC